MECSRCGDYVQFAGVGCQESADPMSAKGLSWCELKRNHCPMQDSKIFRDHETDATVQLAERFGMQFVDLEGLEIDQELVQCFAARDLFRECVLPLDREGQSVRVAIADPLNLEALDLLTSSSGLFVEAVLARADQIERKLKLALGVGGGTVSDLVAKSTDVTELLEASNDVIDDESQASSVVKLVNELLMEAVKQRASDVHIEPEENALAVRYRVDGILRLQPMPPEINRFQSAIINRLKIMAKLNIAEKRLPQDGRITLAIDGREMDVRISVIPMLYGEGVVMRLLDKSQSTISLDAIAFPGAIRNDWNRLIGRSHGMVLVTGPTGSGKTTTLYSSLVEIRSPERKIITVEEPIEYNLNGISQIQVQNQIGLSFAAGLRSILRHDPDVVLIGEIRDAETAVSAVQASLTGHLVLSTLHTNDAASAFTRLVDMGIEPYLVASTVEGVLAQRLVRKLCPNCRELYEPKADELPEELAYRPGMHLHRAVGCRDCHNTGYTGRVAMFELLNTDRKLRELCIQQAPSSELRAQALRNGMTSLMQSGCELVTQGTTSIDEVLRVCSDGDE